MHCIYLTHYAGNEWIYNLMFWTLPLIWCMCPILHPILITFMVHCSIHKLSWTLYYIAINVHVMLSPLSQHYISNFKHLRVFGNTNALAFENVGLCFSDQCMRNVCVQLPQITIFVIVWHMLVILLKNLLIYLHQNINIWKTLRNICRQLRYSCWQRLF